MTANSNVFLIDHAWTFRFQEALETLRQNSTLLERVQKLTDDMERLDLPEEESAAPEEEKKDEEAKSEPKDFEKTFLDALNKGGVVFDLDKLGITTLKNLPKFPDQCE